MNLPPYMRINNCPQCGTDIYAQAEEYEAKAVGGRTKTLLRERRELVEDAPKLMSACRCKWLRQTARKVEAVDGRAATDPPARHAEDSAAAP